MGQTKSGRRRGDHEKAMKIHELSSAAYLQGGQHAKGTYRPTKTRKDRWSASDGYYTNYSGW
jgi:hypothetical protein